MPSLLARLSHAAPWLIAALALGARLLPTPRTIDDAFITFRYARNLLDGLGFVYNAGEPVLGTTTPLYTLLMAALAGLTGWRDFPWLALIVNAPADAITCLLLLRLGHTLTGHSAVGLAAALLWAVAPMSVTFAIGGMETSVFILLLVLSADLYLGGRYRGAAFVAALLLLTRPDGVLFAGLLGLDLVWRSWRAQRNVPWREAAIFLLTLTPWVLFAWWTFGSPIPHSVAAKTEAYRLDAGSALIRLIQHYSTPFFENEFLGRGWQLAGVFVYLFLTLTAGLNASRRDTRTWPLALYPWLYFIVFAAANPLIFRWYLAPPLPFFFLFILSGLWQLAEHFSRLLMRFRPQLSTLNLQSATFFLPPSLFLLPSSFFLFTSLAAWTLRPDHGPQWPAPQMAWHALELLYTEVGKDMAGQVAPQRTVIAAGDIGALGYYSDAQMLDTVGLISPQATAYFPLDPDVYAMVYAVPPQLILDERPDYAVFLEIYVRNGLLRDARFQAEYTLLKKIPTDIYGSEGMLVFKRTRP
ncbi:MAG: hypothetical protein RMK99_04900 [Anaerolineales bacterium]|nr:hypothetical protein [Anaerolineales bacterium]